MNNHYIHIDEKRVEAYYEQLASPRDLESSGEQYFSIWPMWMGDLSFDGSDLEKPCYSLYEKAMFVEQRIRRSSQYSPKRHSYLRLDLRRFVYHQEDLLARKVEISDRLILWIAEKSHSEKDNGEDKFGHLILVQDFRKVDGEVKFYGGWTSSQMLSFHGLDLGLPDYDTFNSNPVQVLSEYCLVSEPREINALYRLLSVCKDEQNGLLISTLAYPLLISE